MSSETHGSEDVNDFLQRIKELGDRRDQEDEERTRKLEEEILQGRKERQARRSERARSNSPTKSSPANTPTASKISLPLPADSSQTLSPKVDPETRSELQRTPGIDDAMDRLTDFSLPPTKENHSRGNDKPEIKKTDMPTVSPSTAMPSRNSPLSWQRRPTSRGSDHSKSRPLSMVATENAARSPKAVPTPEISPTAAEPVLSRDQIAQSLAGKDPAWFRQTADRGANSPAYRRNQVEDKERSDHGQTLTRVQMPGMSREDSMADKEVEDPIDQSSSPSLSSAALGSTFRASYHASSFSSGRIGSPLPLTDAQRLDPPGSDTTPDNRNTAMSPSQGRISPERLERPLSPTKGMGGFVQSAMMKRSDSVNKRWSVQSPTTLNRKNSVASNRTDVTTSGLSQTGAPRPSSTSRENSPRPSSRPTSSRSNTAFSQERAPAAVSLQNSSPTIDSDGFVKPSLPASRSQTPQGGKLTPEKAPPSVDARSRINGTPPSSPTKTSDSRRWSPTKSSWLESALNKPESPKPKATPPPQQPSWMSEINKAKQKSSADIARGPMAGIKHEVNIGGLMRSPPPGSITKPLGIGGLSSGLSPASFSKNSASSISSQEFKDDSKRNDSTDSPTPARAIRSPPIVTKPKPETLSQKDSRAALKPRQAPSGNSGASEPEFKNVFGQLRPTQTKNYVAPDELKSNITRGKAALNITGGPKKTERADEFKEAILKKKDDFKKIQLEGKGVRPASGTVMTGDLPEALKRRNTLSKSAAGAIPPDPYSIDTASTSHKKPPKPTTPSKEGLGSSVAQGKEALGGKLAGRFNPALAGLLARGPPSQASETSRSSSPANSSISQRTVSMSTATTDTQEPGPQLTHMTKGRVRGPRRKAPTSAPSATKAKGDKPELASTKVTEEQPAQAAIAAQKSLPPPKTLEHTTVDTPVSQPSSPRKLDMKRRSQFLQEAPNKANHIEPQSDTPKPLSSTKKFSSAETSLTTTSSSFNTPTPSTMQPTTPAKSSALVAAKSPPTSPTLVRSSQSIVSPKPAVPSSSEPVIPSSPTTVTIQAKPDKPQPLKTVKSVTALWDRPSDSVSPQQSPRVRSPIKLPTHDDERAAMISAGLRSPSPNKALAPANLKVQPKAFPRSLPTLPAKGAQPASASILSSPTSPRLASPGSEASSLVEFFTGRRAPTEYRTDTVAILDARLDQGRVIKTLGTTHYQLGADGKKSLVSSHQERVFFEENMYLCIHVFLDSKGRQVTEVYYWIGGSVPKHVGAEVEAFAQREAKSNGGKLVIINQGKETPELLRALGGIVIIRRGIANKFDSLAPSILCARKHFGQIVFDEIDFFQNSLCSGFPFIVSTGMKTYLWKGKGSGVEELSSARLVGMESALTGEIEEVDDGNETSSFLEIFGGAEIPKSADHWRLKPRYPKYCSRLFCADSSSKEQVTEISPFCQADVTPSKIYILDAFFEIYIIVGARAQSQYSAFHTALTFVQEYGIFAASMEDRPFVPVSTVVIEGVPRDMKSVFRAWREELTPTTIQKAGLQRGRSLRVIPLNVAIEATR